MLPILLRSKGSHYYQKMKGLFTTSLIAYFPLWEPSGSTITDIKNGNNGTYNHGSLGASGIGDGKTGAICDGLQHHNIYSAAFKALFNNSEITVIIWAQIAAAQWTDGTLRRLFYIGPAYDNRIEIYKSTVANTITVLHEGTVGSDITKTVPISCSATTWQCVAVTYSLSNNRLRGYLNGVQQGADVAGVGTWSGTLASDKVSLGCILNTTPGGTVFIGNLAHMMVLNCEATPSEVASVSRPFDCRYILFEGDSKTAHADWTEQTRDGLMNSQGIMWIEDNIGVAGETAATVAASCNADISSTIHIPVEMTINLGANDISVSPTDPDAWYNSMAYIINAYHSAFPGCNIRLVKVWKRGFPAAVAALVAKVELLYTNFPWLKTGIDETAILPGGDDGATMTTDGVHYSEAGKDAIAAAWKVAIGY